MRVFACILATSLVVAAPARADQPNRVVSLKLCTDELVMALAAPHQIASVTYLAQQPEEFPRWREARRYRKNDGSLMSVAALAPDLVVDMGGGGRDTARIARRLGVRVIDLPYPQSLGDLEAAIRQVAAALGRPAAGARLVARLQAVVRSAPRRQVKAVWLGGGGRSLATRGLGAEWMALAGLRQQQLPGDRLTLEQLLVDPPPLLVRSDYRAGQYSSEQRWLSHPLVRANPRSRIIPTDGRRWTCMGPPMIDETLRLRRLVRR